MVMGQDGDTHVDDVGQLHQDQGLRGLGRRAHCHHQHLGGDSQGGPAGRGTGCHRDGDTARLDSRGSPTHLGGGRISPSVRYSTAPMTKWDDSSVSVESTRTRESTHGCSQHAGGNTHMAQTHGHMRTRELACTLTHVLSQMCTSPDVHSMNAQPLTCKLSHVHAHIHAQAHTHSQTCKFRCVQICAAPHAHMCLHEHSTTCALTHVHTYRCVHACTFPDMHGHTRVHTC